MGFTVQMLPLSLSNNICNSTLETNQLNDPLIGNYQKLCNIIRMKYHVTFNWLCVVESFINRLLLWIGLMITHIYTAYQCLFYRNHSNLFSFNKLQLSKFIYLLLLLSFDYIIVALYQFEWYLCNKCYSISFFFSFSSLFETTTKHIKSALLWMILVNWTLNSFWKLFPYNRCGLITFHYLNRKCL